LGWSTVELLNPHPRLHRECRTISGLAPLRSIWLECVVRKLRKYPLSLESGESESLPELFVTIRWQIGFRVCRCDVCNRCAYAFVHRGCQKGVDVARMRPAEHRGHGRDWSALVDLVSHGCVEVGTRGKQRVEVGHHAVLVDQGMGRIEVGVPGASHHLAPVVDAGGDGGKISRQSVEVCECAVLPNRGILGGVVSTADCPNNFALVVDALGDSASSEVLKRDGSAVLIESPCERLKINNSSPNQSLGFVVHFSIPNPKALSPARRNWPLARISIWPIGPMGSSQFRQLPEPFTSSRLISMGKGNEDIPAPLTMSE
jgi:hypothetical protein